MVHTMGVILQGCILGSWLMEKLPSMQTCTDAGFTM